MKFYGSGALCYPGTSRVVWDFEDGPFDTVNPEIIRHALAMGYSTKPPEVAEAVAEEISDARAVVVIEAEAPAEVLAAEVPAEQPPEPKKRKGRPPKEKPNADEVEGATPVSVGEGPEISGEIREGDAKGKEVAGKEEKEGE